MEHKVIIVGAGIAGLAAGRLLQNAGLSDFLILEATGSTGGRIQQVCDIAPWPIELGPEFIHGADTSLKDTLRAIGCKLTEKDWPDHFYFAENAALVHSSVQDNEIHRTMELFDSVGSVTPTDPDISARQWLLSRGATQRMVAIADACFATDFGCSIDELGLGEIITERQRWDAGETYMLLDRSLQALVDHLAAPLQAHIRTDWPVHSISYGSRGAVLHGPSGRRKRCAKVLVTASLAVLQSGCIRFRPPLPPAKLGALSRLRMTNAVKVVLGFRERFWPAELFDVVCIDCFIPEFWVTTYPVQDRASNGSSSSSTAAPHAMVGFVTGQRAVDASSLGEAAVLSRTLKQLDAMFGDSACRQPATDALAKAHIADWSKQPFVRGCYSHPSLGARPGDRAALGASVCNAVFFAGEATHEAVNPCLQAASDTGERGAREILASLSGARL